MAVLNVDASVDSSPRLGGRRGRQDGRPNSYPERNASQRAGPLDAGPTLRRYATPRLVRLAHIDELVDTLGPAQAGYGGAGLMP